MASPTPTNAGAVASAHPATEEVSNASNNKIQNLKFLNAAAFLLTCLVVLGVVLGRVREEGVFGNEYLWMKYQTLLTPASYVNYIWVVLFLLQGLFIYAATLHPALQHSPLVGYPEAVGADPQGCVVVHYPAVCAATLLMVVCHDHGYVFLAFSVSLLLGYVLRKVLVLQTAVLAAPLATASAGDAAGEALGARALRYAALRLPFEMLAGWALALVGLYANVFVHGGMYFLPTAVFLVAANGTLALLTFAGFWTLWRNKLYGVGAALAWYLLGVCVELHSPSQPIYNEFSDETILMTQIVAGMAALATVTLLAVRVAKTFIKGNMIDVCGSTCGGSTRADSTRDEDELDTDYVHA